MSWRVEEVGSSRSAAFASAYDALAAEFAPRGELERREVIAQWVDEAKPARAGELLRTYHLLTATNEDGRLAGVRDCHVVLDVAGGIAVAYLAHVLVLPPFRRGGLGAVLRAAPIALAQRAMTEAGMDAHGCDLLLAAEMEPPTFQEEATLVRLVVYGKDGFAAVSPAALPYWQPDFSELRDPAEARPIPLLAVVRFVGHEGAASLPKRLARAFVRHLYAVFATHVRHEHLAALETRTLGVLDSVPYDEVPLLPLPRTLDDRAAVLPLTRAGTAIMELR